MSEWRENRVIGATVYLRRDSDAVYRVTRFDQESEFHLERRDLSDSVFVPLGRFDSVERAKEAVIRPYGSR